MKNILRFLLLSPMVLMSTSCGKNDTPKDPIPVDVVVISGQSNAVGCTWCDCIKRSIGYSKYQEYSEGYNDIQIAFDSWTKDEDGSFYSQNKSKDNNFMKVILGQGNGLHSFGPEIGIADSMHEKYAGKLFIIKYACGASNLKDDWMKDQNKMYPKLINYVKTQMQNLEAKGYIPTIKAFCWMQGEGDAWDGYHEHYYDNTKQFVQDIRADLKDLAAGNEELPFIDAAINAMKARWPKYKEVNAAKVQFSEESENNIFIDTNAEGLHTNVEPFNEPDTAHYDSESQVKLGELFAQSFEKYLSNNS